MGGRTDWKKILFIVWAIALVFLLSNQLAVASSSHNGCAKQCRLSCGSQNCGASIQVGCNCSYICKDGTEGGSICVQ